MDAQLNCLYVYLTDQCNLACTHCWQAAPLAGKKIFSYLNFDECENFFKNAVDMGLKRVIFSGGEPLLNPELKKFSRFFCENDVSVTCETNGMLISDSEIFSTIKENKVYCAVSIDGATPGTHNKHRGHVNAFQQTIAGIEKLDREGIHYQLIMAVSNFNYHELIPLLDLVKKKFKHCDTFKINVVIAVGRAQRMEKKGLLFKPEDLVQMTEDVALLLDKYPFNIILHIDPAFFSFKNLLKRYSCGGNCGFKSSLSVLANGNISICSLGKQFPDFVFGNVTDADLENVWNSNPVLTELHTNTHTKLKGICANCIFRKKCFGGCRAEALCVYGDFFGPSPRCQTFYDAGLFPRERLINAQLQCDEDSVNHGEF